MATELEELRARVTVLEDREQIRRLIQDYRRTLDERHLRSYSKLFAENGTWAGSIGEATGPAAILTMMQEHLEENPPAPGRTLFHLNTDPVIDVDGDRATAYTFWVHLVRGEGDTPLLPTLGYYDDVLTKASGQWLFLRREARRHIPSSSTS